MPRIILEFFCRGNSIFDCGVEQKYQNNSQLRCRPGYNVLPFLHSEPATAQTTELERFNSSDVYGRYRKTAVEIILHVSTHGGKLVAGNN